MITTQVSAARPPSQRLLSLDVLRGFDMFWIIGAAKIVLALHKASPDGLVGALATQLDHQPWAGIHCYDLIFPLFIFIVGASMVFSLTRILEESGKWAAVRRVFRRSLLLYLVGIFYYGGISEGVDRIRLMGVLQRIALCHLFAGVLFCNFRLRGLIAVSVLLLGGYWALMTFVPVPGVGAGVFAEGSNLANYVDQHYLPWRKWDGDHDPEGLLSTLPAIATCLIGVFAGLLLRNRNLSESRKVAWLVVAGIAGVGLGSAWGLQFPVIKKLWTSSFVLVAGGYSCLLLAVFHQVIEVWKVRKWTGPFVWIGMNPIAIYLTYKFVDFQQLASRLVGGPVKLACGNYGDLLLTLVVLGMGLMFVRFLYQRKLFLKL
jgi:hypothetical protein